MYKEPQANPQGKAALPELAELQHWRNSALSSVGVDTLLARYLCSLLVLSADFNFKPRPGPAYHLYYRHDRWQLSLIGPGEWQPQRWREYVARCTLRADASWHVEASRELAQQHDALEALLAFERAFRAQLCASARLEDELPHYERALPYYRRVLASGLASSMQHALVRLGLAGQSGDRLLSLAGGEAGSALSLADLHNGDRTRKT